MAAHVSPRHTGPQETDLRHMALSVNAHVKPGGSFAAVTPHTVLLAQTRVCPGGYPGKLPFVGGQGQTRTRHRQAEDQSPRRNRG